MDQKRTKLKTRHLVTNRTCHEGPRDSVWANTSQGQPRSTKAGHQRLPRVIVNLLSSPKLNNKYLRNNMIKPTWRTLMKITKFQKLTNQVLMWPKPRLKTRGKTTKTKMKRSNNYLRKSRKKSKPLTMVALVASYSRPLLNARISLESRLTPPAKMFKTKCLTSNSDWPSSCWPTKTRSRSRQIS